MSPPIGHEDARARLSAEENDQFGGCVVCGKEPMREMSIEFGCFTGDEYQIQLAENESDPSVEYSHS